MKCTKAPAFDVDSRSTTSFKMLVAVSQGLRLVPGASPCLLQPRTIHPPALQSSPRSCCPFCKRPLRSLLCDRMSISWPLCLFLCILCLVAHGAVKPNEYIIAHNKRRCLHGVNDLRWSYSVATSAAKYAAKCIFEHENPPNYGENLWAGYWNPRCPDQPYHGSSMLLQDAPLTGMLLRRAHAVQSFVRRQPPEPLSRPFLSFADVLSFAGKYWMLILGNHVMTSIFIALRFGVPRDRHHGTLAMLSHGVRTACAQRPYSVNPFS